MCTLYYVSASVWLVLLTIGTVKTSRTQYLTQRSLERDTELSEQIPKKSASWSRVINTRSALHRSTGTSCLFAP